MDQKIKSALLEHAELYKRAEYLYKKGQLKTVSMPLEPQNEFRYCARAQRDVLEYLANGGNDYDQLSKILEPATRALKCAINDTVDFIVLYAKVFVNRIREKYKGFDISSEYGHENFLQLFESIAKIEEKISDTRGSNGNGRLQAYYDFFDNELKPIISFLDRAEILEDSISYKYKLEEEKERKRQEIETRRIESEQKAREDARISREQNKKMFDVAMITLAVTIVGIFIGVFAADLRLLVFPEETKTKSIQSPSK